MYTKQILAVAATFAAAASATANFLPIARRDFVEARVTGSGDDSCSSALGQILPIYTEIPYPPQELLTVQVPTDPCVTPDITGSLAAEYTSYTSKVLGWYSQHSAELISALTGCSQLAGYATELPVCSTQAAAYPTATKAAPEETGYSSSGSGSSGSDSGSGSEGESYGSGSEETSAAYSAGGAEETSAAYSAGGAEETSAAYSAGGAEETSAYNAGGADETSAGYSAEETSSAYSAGGSGAEPSVTGFGYSSSTATKSAEATYATAAAARETGFAAGIIAAAGLAAAIVVL